MEPGTRRVRVLVQFKGDGILLDQVVPDDRYISELEEATKQAVSWLISKSLQEARNG
jgi:hypothetical protein